MKTSSLLQRGKELILGLFMIALAVFYMYFGTKIRVRSTVSVSARLIPELLGMLVLALGALQTLAGARRWLALRRKDAAEGAVPVLVTPEEGRDAVPILLTFVLIILYALSFEWLGFVIASVLCMFCQMWILTPKGKFRPAAFAIISVIVALVVYVVFRDGLNLMLPQGLLQYLPF